MSIATQSDYETIQHFIDQHQWSELRVWLKSIRNTLTETERWKLMVYMNQAIQHQGVNAHNRERKVS